MFPALAVQNEVRLQSLYDSLQLPFAVVAIIEDTLVPMQGISEPLGPIPPAADALIARMVGAGPRHRIEFV
jgi:hypothetical protein